MKTNIEKLDNNEVKITVSIDAKDFEKYHDKGFKRIQENVEIDGFRKGHAPEDMIIAKYGEMAILEEMANFAIQDTYISTIIKENEGKVKDEDKVFPISDPVISITKLGKGSDFEYTATFPVLPKIELGDYKKISKQESEKVLKTELEEAKKINKDVTEKTLLEVSDKEIDEALENLRQSRNPHTHVHADGTVHHESHDAHDNNIETNEMKMEEKKELPPIDDAFAQTFGPDFKTLSDLKSKIKENMLLEKKLKFSDKKRNYILEKLIQDTKVSVPEVLIINELEKMKAQMKADVERFGAKWEDYLVHVNKKEEDLKLEWRDNANKRVISQLVLNDIARKENLYPSPAEIETEAERLQTEYREVNIEHIKAYVTQILQNEKVMKFLEE